MTNSRVATAPSLRRYALRLIAVVLILSTPLTSFAESDLFIGWSLYNYRPVGVSAQNSQSFTQNLVPIVRTDLSLASSSRVPFVVSGTFYKTDLAVSSAYGQKPNVLQAKPLILFRTGIRPGMNNGKLGVHARLLTGWALSVASWKYVNAICDDGTSSGEVGLILPLSIDELEPTVPVPCAPKPRSLGKKLLFELGGDIDFAINDSVSIRALWAATSTGFGDENSPRQWGPEFGIGVVFKVFQ